MTESHTQTKGERTRQLLLDHAVDEILTVGVDKLSFTGIAKRAGLTTGSLYSRYEERSELLIDVWQCRCQPVLHEFLQLVAASLTLEGTGERRHLAEILRSPSPELMVAIELLVVARRIDELGEIVMPWLVTEFRDGTVNGQTDQFQYIAAITVGSLLVTFGIADDSLDWTEFCDVSFNAWANAPRTKKVELPKIGLEGWIDGEFDDAERRLIRSTLEVVAKTGFERATVSRIARRSGMNPATLYQRYADKEQLMTHVIEKAVVSNLANFTSLNRSFSADNVTDFHLVGMALAAALMEPQFKEVRQIRLEVHLAAAHNTSIGAFLREQARRVFDADVSMLRTGVAVDVKNLRPFAVAMRGLISGLSLFKEIGVLDSHVPPAFVLVTDPGVLSQFLSAPSQN